VHVNAYVTPPGSQGFGSHFDQQDAFILQVEGSKDWTLREPALARPLAHESWDHLRQRPGWDAARLEETCPWRRLTLRPGDCLWLPRGWVHSARSGQVMSLHLTLSLATWTEHWAALELLSRIAEGSARESLPADFVADPGCAAAVAARVRANLATWFGRVPDAELGEILRTAAMREFPAAPCQVVAAGDEISPEQEFTVHPETVFAAVEREDGLILDLAGRVVTIPAVGAQVCAAILSLDRFSLKDLDADHDAAATADVVRLLRDEGIIDGRQA
jgi:bifunctional lysine-specific demethylase and histidyl-hydroxylase NO66